MKIKLIAVDLDDTLLDEQRAVTPEVRAAVAQATAQGIAVVLTSGRMLPSVALLREELGLAHAPVVCCNGAYVVLPDSTLLFRRPIPKPAAHAVLRYAQARDWHVHYYIGDAYYFFERRTEADLYARAVGVTGSQADLFALEEAPDKLLIIHYPDVLDEVEPMRARFPALSVTTSKPYFLELNDPGANKGAAVQALAAHYGLSPAQVMCIGDGRNDLPMLTLPGVVSVAMGNAAQEIKRVCRHVTLPNTQSGVAHAIRTWALEPKDT